MTHETVPAPEVIDAHIAALNAEDDRSPVNIDSDRIAPPTDKAELKASFMRAKWARERVDARIARLTEKQEPTKVASAELKTRAKAEVEARKAWDAAKAK